MTTKNKSIYDSGTTKGSAPRTSDRKRYSDNWEKIFEEKRTKRKMKKKTAIVSGYFDPLHIGHLEYFKMAKDLADELIVIVNNRKQCM